MPTPIPPLPSPQTLALPAQEYIRRLEQQLGKARSELERLQRDNRTLQRKATVLTKHESFRRCAAGMLAELQQARHGFRSIAFFSMSCWRVLWLCMSHFGRVCLLVCYWLGSSGQLRRRGVARPQAQPEQTAGTGSLLQRLKGGARSAQCRHAAAAALLPRRRA
jgi:hypothetical protein